MTRITGPDGVPYEVETSDVVVCYGVDAQGLYLGLVNPATAFATVENPPPDPTGWRYVNKQWRRIVNLTRAKLEKWRDLKDARNDAEFGTFVWDGSEFDCDAVSTMRIMGAAQMALIATANSLPYSQTWTLADNTTRDLTAADMVNLALALGAHTNDVHITGRTLRTQIAAATTLPQVNAINWP